MGLEVFCLLIEVDPPGGELILAFEIRREERGSQVSFAITPVGLALPLDPVHVEQLAFSQNGELLKPLGQPGVQRLDDLPGFSC